ncbi:MAG: MaoC/PaaZ C-terminal domain-containing protein [Woeseiaceae bacterium]|nr:MaoC/PaaZ C-terminal domain-containing protein [Woeseiaceae bacterium]
MSLDYDAVLAAGLTDAPCHYGDRAAMLYALAAGFAGNGEDGAELDYAFEGRALKTVPTLAAVLLDNRFLDDCGWDAGKVATVDQRLELYRPLPPAAELHADRRVVAALDHGKGKGASVLVESEVRMAKDGTVLFTLSNTLLARGVGGFGGPQGELPLPHQLPEREPDLQCDLPSHATQSLLYRLLGDRNPVYADDALARRHGYDRAPLHEQCTAGMACRAILKTICEYDFTLIAGFDLRFTAPMYPGEILTTEMWQVRNIVSFRGVVRARNAVVIDNGRCALAG